MYVSLTLRFSEVVKEGCSPMNRFVALVITALKRGVNEMPLAASGFSRGFHDGYGNLRWPPENGFAGVDAG
jgi:hypothetical protein